MEPTYGWDHGVFIPLKVMFPDADVPVVAMSLLASLDPALHCALGEALRPIRDEGLRVVASGAGSDAPARKLWTGLVGPAQVSAWAFD